MTLEETDKQIQVWLKNAKNDGITNPTGIYEFLFDGNYSHMSDRAFPSEMKKEKWDMQSHKCAICGSDLAWEDAAGDHIVPWSEGGKTIMDNLQVLCVNCNATKSAKMQADARKLVESLRTAESAKDGD